MASRPKFVISERKSVSNFDEEESKISCNESQESALINLYNNAFFLHSFLDENIAPGKGNNFYSTFVDFIVHSPEQYKTKLWISELFVKNIDDIIKKILGAKCVVDI